MSGGLTISSLAPWNPSLAVRVGFVGLSLAAGGFGAFKIVEHFQRIQDQRKSVEGLLRKRDEELVSVTKAFADIKTELQTTTTSLASCMKEIERLTKRLSGTEKELEAVRRQTRALTEQNKVLALENGQLHADKLQLSGEVRQLKGERQDIMVLLEQRTTELKGAEAFLTKTDTVSNADVIKMMEELNSEVFQTAALMSEGFKIDEKIVDDEAKEHDSDEMQDALARTEEILGPRMTEMLRNAQHHEDPVIVQLGFQSALAAYVHWIISSWCFESPEDENMLTEIYARVRESEEQAVSGRWRQMTRNHLQRMLQQPLELSSDMAGTLAQILLTAGKKDAVADLHHVIMQVYAERIQHVMDLAKKLNKTIGEHITSCDLEALYISPDVMFDPNTMEDGLDNTPTRTEPPQSTQHELVLGTTELGLVRAEKVPGTLGEWHESVLLRPKVILPSAISELFSTSD